MSELAVLIRERVVAAETFINHFAAPTIRKIPVSRDRCMSAVNCVSFIDVGYFSVVGK